MPLVCSLYDFIGTRNFMTKDWSKLVHKLVQNCNKPVLGSSGLVHTTYETDMD